MIADPSDLDPPDDEDFPLGDGTTETEVVVVCPHCGEANELGLDPGGGPLQEYVEDCQVCCRPWRVTVRYGSDGSADVRSEEHTSELQSRLHLVCRLLLEKKKKKHMKTKS